MGFGLNYLKLLICVCVCAFIEGLLQERKSPPLGWFLDDALQLFLQCLALDEDFAPAKLEVEKVIRLPTVTLPASFPTTQVFLQMPVRLLG